MRMTSAMRLALKGFRPIIVGMLEINLPGYDLRLINGASELVWGEAKFVGRDPIYGAWTACEAFSDGLGDTAPGLSITLAPTSAANAGELTAPDCQGSRMRVWFACVDANSGGIVPDPMLLYDGELDQPILNLDKRTLTLEYESVTAFEGLFLDDEGIRLSDAHHQSLWPGELGLEYMTGTNRTIIWGPGDRPDGIVYTMTRDERRARAFALFGAD